MIQQQSWIVVLPQKQYHPPNLKYLASSSLQEYLANPDLAERFQDWCSKVQDSLGFHVTVGYHASDLVSGSLVLWFSCSSKVHVCVLSCFSCVWLFATIWTVALQAPLFMGFSRQEYWVDCHALLQWIFLTQGSTQCLSHLLCLLHWQAGSLPLAPPGKPTPQKIQIQPHFSS